MKLTDAQLNEAMACALGWRKERHKEGGWMIVRPDGTYDLRFNGTPANRTEKNADYWLANPSFTGDYCQNRNLLPQIWAKVEEAGSGAFTEFERLLAFPMTRVSFRMSCQTQPRDHVICALKVLGCWRKEWEETP